LYIILATETSERLEAIEEAIDILKKDMVNTFVGTSISKSKVLELKPFDRA
jgi:hypothetical protein